MPATGFLRVICRLAVRCDFVPAVSSRGVDLFPQVLRLAPTVPAGVTLPPAHPHIQIAYRPLPVGGEIERFHIRVQKRRAFHAAGVDRRADRERFAPTALCIPDGNEDIERRFVFSFCRIVGGKKKRLAIRGNHRIRLPVAYLQGLRQRSGFRPAAVRYMLREAHPSFDKQQHHPPVAGN